MDTRQVLTISKKYCEEKHAPIASKMIGVLRFACTEYLAGPDGSRPAFYRMADLYFADQDQMRVAMASPEGQATASDRANFATGGATLLVGMVEE